MPARTISVAEALPKIFDQVQKTNANHQKNAIALQKVHLDAATFTESIHGGRSIKLTGEREFEDTFIELLCRVVVLKRGVSQADRVTKFVRAYIVHLNSTSNDARKEEDDNDDDTTTSRFVARLLKFLLKGFVAKDKNVRYRCVNILTEMVAHLGEIDEDVYQVLRAALIERIHDKETHIRVQAVVALSKLCGSEDPSDIEDEQTAIDVLIDTLSYDPAPEVRRATLVNIPITQYSLPAILSRSRDTDFYVRRLIYHSVLEKNCMAADSSTMGSLHPRVLTIAQRELIIRNGLGDREPSVRAAAGSLLGTWVDVVRGSTKAEEGGAVIDDVLALLGLFDLSENTVAEDALLSIFATRVDIFDQLEFKDSFWDTLTPEKAFLARVYVEHCISTNDQSKLEASLPVVTHLAYRIQKVYNKYQEDLDVVLQERALSSLDANERPDDEADERLEDLLLETEFVVAEMFKLAVNLDYADEIGRRKMFSLVRDMIGQECLPEGLVARCLDVLRVLSPSERDLIRVVVEVVHELRDDSEGQDGEEAEGEGGEEDTSPSISPSTVKTPKAPKPAEERSAEEEARADALDLRCLSLCIGMLERVNGTFEENSTLEGILGELIVPSVKRKELAFREKGLVCLGLCCLIARRMALNSFQLFLSQVQTAPEVLKMRVLQIVFDILMVHEADFLGRGGIGSDRIVEFLLHVLNEEDSDKIQALLCIGLAKLVLAGMVSDQRVLKSLVVAYLSPDTASNQELRQCLAYFFPVYCYSSSVNQKRMCQIAVPIFEQLAVATRDLDEDQEMVSTAQIIGMFTDWTDPQKAIEVQGQTIDDSVHLDLAEDILKALFKDDLEKEDKKALCQVIGRLYLPDTVDDDKIRTLKLLVQNIFTRRPIRDISARNALTKFDTTISKKYAEKLSNFSEEEYRQLKQLEELFKFLDDIVPLDDGEEIEMPRTRGRKRRSESVMTETTVSTTTEETSIGSRTSEVRKAPKRKGKARESKRRRVSQSGEDEDEELPEGYVEATPKRTLPKRAASVKKTVPVQNISDDDEEDEEDEATPAPKRPSTRGRAPGPAPTLKGRNSSIDSIMDSEEEEEEEVVSLVVKGDE